MALYSVYESIGLLFFLIVYVCMHARIHVSVTAPGDERSQISWIWSFGPGCGDWYGCWELKQILRQGSKSSSLLGHRKLPMVLLFKNYVRLQ